MSKKIKNASYYFKYLVALNIIKILKGVVMLKNIIKKTFKRFGSINLEEYGYHKIKENLLDVDHMINQGILKYSEQKPKNHMFFEKKHEHGLSELLILSNERITSAIFINNNIIYKNKFGCFSKNNKTKYSIMKDFSHVINNLKEWVNYYKEMLLENKKNHLILISNYARSRNKILNYQDIGEGPVLSIMKHLSEIDVYYLVNSEESVSEESDVKVLKVIGENIYKYSAGKLNSLSSMIKETGLDFEGVSISWLHHPTPSPEISEKSSCIELNFNDKSFLYIKLQQMRYCEKEVNFVIFKNHNKKNLLDYSAVNILNNQELFEVIAVDYTNHTNINGLYKLFNDNEYFMNEYSVKKFIVKELFKECLTKESRESLGFKPSGDLDDREMMIVAALTM